MPYSPLFSYFDRIAIINLPERTDRMNLLRPELARVGFDINSPKVVIPPAPRPSEANGFRSRGVYGNLLSHLSILENALADNLKSVLILEDDAIFSRSFNTIQGSIADSLRANPWDQLFIGHSISTGLPRSRNSLVRYSGEFFWAHCYAVNCNILPKLVDYIRKTIDRPPGHPDGGKMYIDAALNQFRRQTPDLICVITSPCLSVQRGSPSSLNSPPWYDRNETMRRVSNIARAARDECWRRGLIAIGPKGLKRTAPISSAQPWPSSG